jgi:hypothetical protein
MINLKSTVHQINMILAMTDPKRGCMYGISRWAAENDIAPDKLSHCNKESEVVIIFNFIKILHFYLLSLNIYPSIISLFADYDTIMLSCPLSCHCILFRMVYDFPATINIRKPEQHKKIPLKISYEPKLTDPLLIHILFNPIKDVENR